MFFLGYFYKLYGDDPNRKNIKIYYDDLTSDDQLLKDDLYKVYTESKKVFEIIEKNGQSFYQKLIENIRVNYIGGNIKNIVSENETV